ncbi:MAG: SIS domain-containing protein [Fimbriimonadaceae bacterium]|nr:SIS domain-containing protein [Fimbriimonadaceae bacterium]
MSADMKSSIISAAFETHLIVAQKMHTIAQDVERAGEIISECLNKHGGAVLVCGNGGSAADAQHIAGELTGRFLRERRAMPALALNTNSTTITAIGNDYGYDFIFSRQVEAHGRPESVLIAITTSGNSGNVVQAAKAAKASGMKVIGMTGSNAGMLGQYCDVCIKAPSSETPRIQEMHILIGHILCEIAESEIGE